MKAWGPKKISLLGPETKKWLCFFVCVFRLGPKIKIFDRIYTHVLSMSFYVPLFY